MTGIEVVMWDERCTTVSAHNYLNEVNVRGKNERMWSMRLRLSSFLKAIWDSGKILQTNKIREGVGMKK